MTLPGVLFLAAFTARSRAYAQAMAAAGLSPEWVLLFGDPDRDMPDPSSPAVLAPDVGSLLLPDLTVPLRETCASAGWQADHSTAGDINDDDVSRRLTAFSPRLVVYSGYGGQLVKPPVIDLGFEFLHLHCGWLPDYRGSTTVYYSWLNEGRCGVTALVLDHGIDTGPIVARRHYPSPPAGVDVDRVYDCAIRADLLVQVLRDYAESGRLPTRPNPAGGRTYYVIHPVLKHVALVSREETPSTSSNSTARRGA